MSELNTREMATLRQLWDGTKGKAWEPGKLAATDARFDPYVRAGYLKRVDGRCGFERFKDSMLAWTEAGRPPCLSLTPSTHDR